MQEPRIDTVEPKRLVGLQARFISGLASDTNAGDVIGPLWKRLHERLDEIQALHDRALYGWTCFAAPEDRTHPEELLYVAGAEVAPDGPVPEGMVAVTVEGPRFAAFEHRGPITRFGETLRAIYEAWLPSAPWQGNGRGDLEVYDERWRGDAEDSVFEYWVGIEPKAR